MLSDDLHISTTPTYKSYHSPASLTASLSLSIITPVLLSLPCHRVDISVECRYHCVDIIYSSPPCVDVARTAAVSTLDSSATYYATPPAGPGPPPALQPPGSRVL